MKFKNNLSDCATDVCKVNFCEVPSCKPTPCRLPQNCRQGGINDPILILLLLIIVIVGFASNE